MEQCLEQSALRENNSRVTTSLSNIHIMKLQLGDYLKSHDIHVLRKVCKALPAGRLGQFWEAVPTTQLPGNKVELEPPDHEVPCVVRSCSYCC
jgi:hypothetical protein